MSVLDTAPALWDPTTQRVYTFMVPGPDPGGPLVSAWGRETHEQMIATGQVSADSVVLPQEEAFALQDSAERRSYCTGPRSITAEDFDEALNILPPERWHRSESSESFCCPEALCGLIYTFYVRLGTSYFAINDYVYTTHDRLCRLCSGQFL